MIKKTNKNNNKEYIKRIIIIIIPIYRLYEMQIRTRQGDEYDGVHIIESGVDY